MVLAIITACSEQQPDTGVHFENPIVKQRADPWVYRTDEGHYYFTATVPEFNRIELRHATTLNELSKATPKVIWRKAWQGPMSANIWAPKLHRIDDVWYIYFAAGTAGGDFDVRPYVLSNKSQDPMQGKWQEEGRIETDHDAFALDASSFEHRGQRFLLWSQKDAEDERPPSLHISEMSNPTTLSGPEVMIAEPEYDWEQRGLPANQGASVLIRHGKVFVIYTASATDHRSALGLLWANADANLLDPNSWNKRAEPVFITESGLDRQGPGHASFTKAEDGETDVMLYHSREYRDLHGGELADPNRHTRARVLEWDAEGWPVFNSSQGD